MASLPPSFLHLFLSIAAIILFTFSSSFSFISSSSPPPPSVTLPFSSSFLPLPSSVSFISSPSSLHVDFSHTPAITGFSLSNPTASPITNITLTRCGSSYSFPSLPPGGCSSLFISFTEGCVNVIDFFYLFGEEKELTHLILWITKPPSFFADYSFTPTGSLINATSPRSAQFSFLFTGVYSQHQWSSTIEQTPLTAWSVKRASVMYMYPFDTQHHSIFNVLVGVQRWEWWENPLVAVPNVILYNASSVITAVAATSSVADSPSLTTNVVYVYLGQLITSAVKQGANSVDGLLSPNDVIVFAGQFADVDAPLDSFSFRCHYTVGVNVFVSPAQPAISTSSVICTVPAGGLPVAVEAGDQVHVRVQFVSAIEYTVPFVYYEPLIPFANGVAAQTTFSWLSLSSSSSSSTTSPSPIDLSSSSSSTGAAAADSDPSGKPYLTPIIVVFTVLAACIIIFFCVRANRTNLRGLFSHRGGPRRGDQRALSASINAQQENAVYHQL